MSRHRHRRTPWAIAIGLVFALTAVGCSNGATVESADEASPEGTAAEPPSPSPTATATDEEGEPFEIAYLSASSANTWLAASREEMEAVAAENNVALTEFDAQFTPGAQSRQIQDIIVSGDYDGIIIAAIDGAGIIPDLEEAMDAGLKVGILNQVIGEAYDTPDPQFEGPVVSVLAPPRRSGERMGELALEACQDKSPCNVVYFYGIRGTPIDTALREGFDTVTGVNADIEVVAEAEGQYLGPDVALAAMQDILQRTQDIDVVVGPDQTIQGAELALKDEGLLDRVSLIGLGGSEPAIQGIRDGRWFGTVFGAPADEGRIVIEAMVAALRDDSVTGGVDPLAELPDDGLVTADNVELFEPQWAG